MPEQPSGDDLPEIRTRWSEVSGGIDAAHAYQRRFDELASGGADLDGEARFVHGLHEAPVRVLDAGCGTGRVATELTRLGHDVVGVDADAAMIEVANSGSEVPMAITVKPITSSDRPRARASCTAPSTSRLDPPTNSPRPTTTRPRLIAQA